jgi:hypothetical protein
VGAQEFEETGAIAHQMTAAIEFFSIYAFLGGALVGCVGVIFVLFHAGRSAYFDETNSQRVAAQEFRDGKIIIAIATLLQALLIPIPLLFDTPNPISADLQPMIVIAACAMTTLWCWGIIKLFRSAAKACQRITFITELLLVLPLLVSVISILALRLIEPKIGSGPTITVTRADAQRTPDLPNSRAARQSLPCAELSAIPVL